MRLQCGAFNIGKVAFKHMAHHIGSASGRLLLRTENVYVGSSTDIFGTNRGDRFPTSFLFKSEMTANGSIQNR